jgi:lantibiotic modifying enzyme
LYGSEPRPLLGPIHGLVGNVHALLPEHDLRAETAAILAREAVVEDGLATWPGIAGGPLDPPSGIRLQWCHGAPGIGLARLATRKRGAIESKDLAVDIRHAVEGATRGWPASVDTLCCGTLGSVEFLCEAASALEQPDLRELAARQLATVLQNAAAAGDYRWNSGKRQFNLGLFRGLAGVGYTALRQVDRTLPDILIWE